MLLFGCKGIVLIFGHNQLLLFSKVNPKFKVGFTQYPYHYIYVSKDRINDSILNIFLNSRDRQGQFTMTLLFSTHTLNLTFVPYSFREGPLKSSRGGGRTHSPSPTIRVRYEFKPLCP